MIELNTAHSVRLNGIVEESIVDGPGLRFVLFTQGCLHACPSCHNPETHSLTGGYEKGIHDLLLQFMENPLYSGITFSGGEPFLQALPLAVLGEKVRSLGKTVVVYTGYTIEELLASEEQAKDVRYLLDQADMLIDGPYIDALRDLNSGLKGSTNQRIILREELQKLLVHSSEK